ncbi:rho GTPase-activating protein 20-like [Salmo salar]|uniref:Rho GTPase-activating protein 20-like n=1 Tax=Salmo salar TaxID=8030 RepID=A0ABM3EWP9_SALSA|nr:rho GTPase-activating protein 20-like [Salmo salar]
MDTNMEAPRTRTLEDLGIAVMRRGSYDEAAALGLHPHLRSLAQRRRSAPSLAFEKALGSMPWSSIREEAPCWVSVEQCPFVLGLSSENAELVLDACVQITEGMKTRRRQLFLFSDVIAIAMLKSSASYRLKHRVSLEDLWLYGFEDEPEEEEGEGGEIDLRTSLVLAWPLAFCVVSFQ